MGQLEAEWVPARTRIKTVRGQLSAPILGTPETIVKRFLSDYADLFQMRADPSVLEMGPVRESPAGHHIVLRQTYNGLPVFDGGAEVHVAKNGQVSLAHNYFVPGV